MNDYWQAKAEFLRKRVEELECAHALARRWLVLGVPNVEAALAALAVADVSTSGPAAAGPEAAPGGEVPPGRTVRVLTP